MYGTIIATYRTVNKVLLVMSTLSNTKTRIIETSSQLFAKYTYAGVSMSQIAKDLNITKAALYYHYPSKLVIYKHVLDKIYQDFRQHLQVIQAEKTPVQKLRMLIERYLNFNLGKGGLIRMIITQSSDNLPQLSGYIVRFRKQMYDLVRSYAREIIGELGNCISIPLLINMMDGLLLERSLSSKKFNAQKAAKQATMTLLNVSTLK